MRRITKTAALTGAGVLVARGVAPKLKLHERLMARCERMFEQMPEDFPPKRIMHGVEEIRANTERILELLEEREAAGDGQAQRPAAENGRTTRRGKRAEEVRS